MELFLNSGTDYSITDGKGKKYTLDEACDAFDKVIKSGEKFDCNQSFSRLVAYNFDMDAVKKYYAENP